MKTQSRISTEADYLQAHLTMIHVASRRSSLRSHALKQQLIRMLKKLLYAAGATDGALAEVR